MWTMGRFLFLFHVSPWLARCYLASFLLLQGASFLGFSLHILWFRLWYMLANGRRPRWAQYSSFLLLKGRSGEIKNEWKWKLLTWRVFQVKNELHVASLPFYRLVGVLRVVVPHWAPLLVWNLTANSWVRFARLSDKFCWSLQGMTTNQIWTLKLRSFCLRIESGVGYS